jgi:hypothetical protein
MAESDVLYEVRAKATYGGNFKLLADRAEADRHIPCKFLDGQALFIGLFHAYAETYKGMRDSLQPSSMEWEEDDVSQAGQNKRRKGDKL